MEDLLGLGGLDMGGSTTSAQPSNSGGGLDDIFGSSMSSGSATTSSRPIIIDSSANAGYEMRGSFTKDSSTDSVTFNIEVKNLDTSVHSGNFQFQFKKICLP